MCYLFPKPQLPHFFSLELPVCLFSGYQDFLPFLYTYPSYY